MAAVRTVPPVRAAMSCRLFFRLSPNPGAFTAASFTPAHGQNTDLFTINLNCKLGYSVRCSMYRTLLAH